MRLPYAAPDKNLARELRQVRLSANAVESALAEANFLPVDFPREILVDICSSLAGLEQGTAENSRPALEYARNKIPEIRREFFHLEEDDGGLSGEDLEAPRLYRGMALDRHLNTLIGSVTTALDEYRVQAQQRFDDEVRGEDIVVLQKPQETSGPDSDASDVIEASGRAYLALRDKRVDQTEKGEILARRLKDSSNLAFAARSLIRGGKIVRRWFEGITKAILDLPALIYQAGKAIKVGTDVADILADWWSETHHTLVKCSIDQIRRFGIALESISEALNRREALPQSTRKAEDTPRDPRELEAEAEVERLMAAGVEVPSELARLARRLRFQASPGTAVKIARWQDIARCQNLISLILYATDFEIGRDIRYLSGLSHLRELRLPNQSTQDISALGKLTELTTLSLHVPDLTDISPLGELTRLGTLSLQAPEVADISALEKLIGLSSLSLTANNVQDISVLGRLSGLTSLSLTALNANDISALKRLTRLNTLGLHTPDLISIAALGELSSLTSLSFHTPNLADISELGNLTNLTSLSLTANGVEDISALGELTNLTTLTLQAAKLTDISALERLTKLTSLSVTANNAKDISGIEKLTSLASLTLQANSVGDISALEKLTSLRSLDLQIANAQDISPLETLTGLTSLRLQTVTLKDISTLSHLVGLISLNLQTSNVNIISALGNLTNLTTLYLEANNVEDISPLGNLTGLRSLNLQASNASDISPLENLTGLTHLHLQANNARDISTLEKMTGLTSLTITSRASPAVLVKLFALRHLTKLNMTLNEWDWLQDVPPSSNVESLVFSGGGQLDLAPLSGLRKLKTIQINGVRTVNRDALRGVDINFFGFDAAPEGQVLSPRER